MGDSGSNLLGLLMGVIAVEGDGEDLGRRLASRCP